MKIIKPYATVEFFDTDVTSPVSVYEKIEKIARLCYKSEDNISPGSWKKMLDTLRNRGHWAMLEHHNVVVEVTRTFWETFNNRNELCDEVVRTLRYTHSSYCEDYDKYIISGSPTAFAKLWETLKDYWNSDGACFHTICRFVHSIFPYLVQIPDFIPEGYLAGDPHISELMASEGIIGIMSNEQIRELPYSVRRHHEMSTVRFVCDRGACYDDKTKVLTKRGWIYFNSITSEDEFCTKDENGDLVWTHANSIIKRRYEGNLHHWKSTQVDLMVTPNHNMWLYDYEKRVDRDWKFIKSEDANNGRYKFSKSSNPINNRQQEYVVLQGFMIRRGFWKQEYPQLYLQPDAFYELVGWWMTDGSVSFGRRGSGNRIIISQTKPSGRGRILQLLNSLNLSYTLYKREIRVNSPQLFEYLVKHFIRKADARKTYYLEIPRWFMVKLSASDIQNLLKGIVGGDGTSHSSNIGYQIYTASKTFAENIVELSLYAGGGANIYTITPRERKFPNSNKTTMCKEQYVVSLINTTEHLFCSNKSASKTEVPYDGFVYCVELPIHHRLYVMRGGKPVWCGNSHEVVRHRPCAFAQESTRYCNYGKSDDVQFIMPEWFNEKTQTILKNKDVPMKWTSPISVKYWEDMAEFEWYASVLEAERHYNSLIEMGWQPQQARSVLPNSLKTEIYMSAPLQEWEWFFKMRVPKTAHPQMRELTIPLQDEFINLIPEFPRV